MLIAGQLLSFHLLLFQRGEIGLTRFSTTLWLCGFHCHQTRKAPPDASLHTPSQQPCKPGNPFGPAKRTSSLASGAVRQPQHWASCILSTAPCKGGGGVDEIFGITLLEGLVGPQPLMGQKPLCSSEMLRTNSLPRNLHEQHVFLPLFSCAWRFFDLFLKEAISVETQNSLRQLGGSHH